MVMAAKVDFSLSVRSFEELTSTQLQQCGFFSVKMRTGFSIIDCHRNKTDDWQRQYLFVNSDEYAFEEPPKDDSRVLFTHLSGR